MRFEFILEEKVNYPLVVLCRVLLVSASGDRGSPYGSDDYIKRLESFGAVPSMSRKGDCWDNAVAESFFSTLEFECRGLHDFVHLDDAEGIIGSYIDGFYNTGRPADSTRPSATSAPSSSKSLPPSRPSQHSSTVHFSGGSQPR